MSRDERVYLEDIATACSKIAQYTAGMTLDSFRADEKTIDAVVRNLQVIGEAVKHISNDTRARSPETDWKKIAGLRDMVVHHYFGIDHELVWSVVTERLGELDETARRLLIATE